MIKIEIKSLSSHDFFWQRKYLTIKQKAQLKFLESKQIDYSEVRGMFQSTFKMEGVENIRSVWGSLLNLRFLSRKLHHKSLYFYIFEKLEF